MAGVHIMSHTFSIPLLSPSHNFNAVIFDLDGTLVDSVADIAVAAQAMCDEFDLPNVTEGQVKNWIGRGARALVQSVLDYAEQSREVSDAQRKTAFDVFMRHYSELGDKKTQLLPHADSLLVMLFQSGVPMALATNKPRAITLTLLEKLNIAQYFSVVYGGDDFANPKPAPDMLLAAARDLGAQPEQCLMVGDSKNDILSAQACNMPVVALEGGYNHGEPVSASKPSLVLKNLQALKQALIL